MPIRRGIFTISTCFNFHNILRYFCCCSFLLIIFLITFTSFQPSDHGELIDNFRRLYPNLHKNSLNDDAAKKCHFPDLNPWDPSISDYIKNGGDLSCKMLQYDLTFINESNFLILNRTALTLSGFGKSSIDCQYRCFNSQDDVSISTSEIWHNFEWETPLSNECEFLEVDCSRKISSLLSVYSNIHFRMIAKPSNTVTMNDQNQERPNVLLFVIDSQSRSNVERYLPKMSKILNDSDYMSVRMDGFVKIGDNSFPNAIAFLTGKRSCVSGYPDELPCYMGDKYFDDWPLIWHNFSMAGYRTYYAEDHPDFNLFQYTYNGFRKKPVDHYFRPYWLKVWQTFLHRRSSHLCYGNTPKHLIQLNYLERFFKAYQKQNHSPVFALNWLTELGHDWLGQISLGDEDFEQFFQRMKTMLLKNTIIFTFSDHGHRFDSIRKTLIGRLEERMPYLSISLPKKFRTKFPNLRRNLLLNSKRLISPFDIYATLIDILNLNFESAAPKDNSLFGNFGKSLFRPVSENRQCTEAGIPQEYCVCEREISIPEPYNDRLVISAAKHLINYLNDQLLASYANICAKLTLKRINNANIFADGFNIENMRRKERSIFPYFNKLFDGKSLEPRTANFRITIESDPSGAIFEALFLYSLSEDTFKLIGDVNRINIFENFPVHGLLNKVKHVSLVNVVSPHNFTLNLEEFSGQLGKLTEEINRWSSTLASRNATLFDFSWGTPCLARYSVVSL
uniref:Uncharacterized protein n=1 Tax=Romanomermis culicivorax TaxID=13658 RepID=A0A915K925_ROMCU